MKKTIVACLLSIALAIAGCTVSVSTHSRVSGSVLAAQVADILQKQVGAAKPPAIDCGADEIELTNGKIVMCTLADAGEEYDVTVTISDVDGDDFYINAKVADTPR